MYILRTSAVAVTVLTLALSGPTVKASDNDNGRETKADDPNSPGRQATCRYADRFLHDG